MGCCCAREESVYGGDDGDDDVRDPLLGPEVGATTINDSGTYGFLESHIYASPGLPPRAVSPLRAAMNDIVENTTRNLLVVRSGAPDVIGEGVGHERAAQYSERLQACVIATPVSLYTLPAGVTSPNALLFSLPLSQANFNQISQLGHQMARAVHSMQGPRVAEPLVVRLPTHL